MTFLKLQDRKIKIQELKILQEIKKEQTYFVNSITMNILKGIDWIINFYIEKNQYYFGFLSSFLYKNIEVENIEFKEILRLKIIFRVYMNEFKDMYKISLIKNNMNESKDIYEISLIKNIKNISYKNTILEIERRIK